MEGIFIKLLNLSIQASILITVVLLLRFILNKSPKSIKCLLWALVAIRLVCPFSIESKFSLAPDAEVVSMDNYVGMPNVLSKTTGSDRYVKGYAESYDHEVVTVEKKNTDPLHIFSIIWLGGVVILAVYALGSCLKIWRRVKLSIRTTENIYICDRIDSPFIFGIIKPRIYLPSRMNEEQKESVIAHERAHLKRLDHFWKPFGFGLLSVYWFNPLCWLAYILFCRDIELACDEKVIKDMDAKQKKIYSKVLLSFSESEKHVLACPLAFGEVGVKERIKSILNYKKPTFWIIAVAVISILVTSVLFLTNPQNNTYEITFHIPAECEGALVFADEEISPKGKTVSFLVGQDVGDTAIQLKGVEVKEENAYDEPVYATPGMPAKMEVEKGAWFQVGIYASNDTAEEKTVHVTVKDVEVRIAADKDTTAEIAPLQDIIEVSVPTIDLSATTGADGSTMYGYFYDLDHKWYYIIPGPFRIKMPLELIDQNVDERNFEFDFCIKVQDKILRYILGDYREKNPEFAELLNKEGYCVEDILENISEDGLLSVMEFYHKYRTIFDYFDDWILIKTNEENTEITDIVMKKMSENHVETCEW